MKTVTVHFSGLKKCTVTVLSLCLFLGLGACGSYDVSAWFTAVLADPSAPAIESSEPHFKVEIVAEGLESPWAIAAVDDGRLFITERRGRLRLFQDGKLAPEPLPGLPSLSHERQGGLMEAEPHPDFARNGWLYLAYSVPDEASAHTQVARFTVTPTGLTEQQIVFAGVPGGPKHKHFGCRLAFGADGTLYLALGERGEKDRAQDLMDLNGKVLRLNDDGSLPPDNPFTGRADARPEIFSWGHRNPQGLARQPDSGLIWSSEHGPTWTDAPGGGDEVNILRPGVNYGWPEIHHRESAPGMSAPLLEYTPSIAPAGAIFYDGDAFPAWRGDFFFTGLVGEALYRIDVEGTRVLGQEVLLENAFGRLRDVAQGADGFLYVITSDTDNLGPGRAGGDRLLRLVPKG